MSTPFKITTPSPTIEETAGRLGVSDLRLQRIVRLADEIVGKGSATGKRAAAKKRKSIKRSAK